MGTEGFDDLRPAPVCLLLTDEIRREDGRRNGNRGAEVHGPDIQHVGNAGALVCSQASKTAISATETEPQTARPGHGPGCSHPKPNLITLELLSLNTVAGFVEYPVPGECYFALPPDRWRDGSHQCRSEIK